MEGGREGEEREVEGSLDTTMQEEQRGVVEEVEEEAVGAARRWQG